MIEYIVNEEKGVVIAVLKETQADAINKILAQIKNTNHIAFRGSMDVLKKYTLPNKFSGVMKCDPRDTFDVGFGKKKAKEKCLNKYYRSLSKALYRYAEDMNRDAWRVYQALKSR